MCVCTCACLCAHSCFGIYHLSHTSSEEERRGFKSRPLPLNGLGMCLPLLTLNFHICKVDTTVPLFGESCGIYEKRVNLRRQTKGSGASAVAVTLNATRDHARPSLPMVLPWKAPMKERML